MSAKNVYKPERVALVVFIIRDVTTVVVLGLISELIEQFVPPFQRGFNCDDESIRYPYKHSTVSSLLLHSVGAVFNILLIVICEYIILNKQNKQQQQFPTPSANGNANDVGFKWRSYLSKVYFHMLLLLLGMGISELFKSVSKVSVGRLRPNFFDVCQPLVYVDNEWQNATTYCEETQYAYMYHTNYKCSGAVAADEREARLSFMSGHCSFAAYCATHAIIYLQSVIDVSVMGLVKPGVQSAIVAIAFYVGLSRVSDYKHHWQDVLAGFAQGTVVAIVLFRYILPAVKQSYFGTCNKTTTLKRATHSSEMDSGEQSNYVY